MADTFQNTFPDSISFTIGEQPDHTKFTGWASQTESGMRLLDRVIGDVWGEQKQSRVTGGTFPLSTWSDRPLNIANLARLIGPASALNPGRLGTKSILVTFCGSDIPADVHEFQLPEPSLIINQTAKVFSISVDVSMSDNHLGKQLNTIDPAVFATHRSSRVACTANGHYYVDRQGRVYCFQETGLYGATSRNYYTDMLWDTYSTARMNVIPDINETTTLCTVALAANSKQLITLPAITGLPSYNDDGTTRTLPGTLTCAFLPYAITDPLSSGDTIPEGFVYLWDTDTDEICTNDAGGFIVFEYATAGTLYAITTNLDTGSNRYRLITVGTTITETLGELTYNFRNHEHTTDSRQGQPVDHGNLSGLLINDDEIKDADAYNEDLGGFRHSTIGSNDHPQYLLRYGYKDNVDIPNQDNAMLGHLFMAANVASYKDEDDYKTAGASQKIMFGNINNYIYLNASGDLELAVNNGAFNFTNCLAGIMPVEPSGGPPTGYPPAVDGVFVFDIVSSVLWISLSGGWVSAPFA